MWTFTDSQTDYFQHFSTPASAACQQVSSLFSRLLAECAARSRSLAPSIAPIEDAKRLLPWIPACAGMTDAYQAEMLTS
jgi:hypothetical protein